MRTVRATTLLVRPRLLDRIAVRWEQRFTGVVAGAGFGKTTLLTQAVAENRMSPRGADVYLTCRSADTAASLAERASAGLTGSIPGAAPPLEEAVTARAPVPVAVVIDDVHVLSAEARRELAAFLGRLPATGHALLAGRGRLPEPVPTTLDEGALAFDDAEMTLLAEGDDAVLAGLRQTGGWPALVAQVLYGGGSSATEHLTGAILDPLPLADRSLVGVLASVGPVGAPVLAAMGFDPDAADRLAVEVPVLRVDEDGRFVVHDLWSEACRGLLAPEDRRDARQRAAAALAGADDPLAAVEVALAAADWDLVLDLVPAACSHAAASVAGRVAARVLPFVPPERTGHRSALLLAAIGRRWDDPGHPATTRAFEQAIAAYTEAGDDDGAAVALAGLAMVEVMVLGRVADADGTLGPLRAIADAGHASAGAMRSVVDAALHLGHGRPDAALGDLAGDPAADLNADWRTSVRWMRSIANLALGQPGAAVDDAAATFSFSSSQRIGPGTAPVLPHLFAGDPQAAASVLGAWPGPADEPAPVVRLDRGYHGAFVAAALGDAALARSCAADVHASSGIGRVGIGSLVECLAAFADGDEAGARAASTALSPRARSLTFPDAILVARAVGVPYVVDPAQRPEIDALDLDGCWADARRMAEALVRLRDGRAAPAGEVSAGAAAAHLTLRGAVELAVRLDGAGDERAIALAEGCVALAPVPARRLLDACVGADDDALARAAKGLVGRLPVPPADPTTIAVLGPAQVVVDGVPTGHRDWRRERVRALLLHLVHHRRARREVVADALWPELDAARSARNLAVTLNYLHDVLEPDRTAGGATWFVRSDRTWLWLHDDVDVDAWRFEAMLDEAAAADRHGAASACLASLESALRLWRGDYLADVAAEEWAVFAADRLRSRFVQASVRAAELLGALERTDEAIRRATDALEVEPISEPAFRAAAAAHVVAGDRAGARRMLERCRDAVRDLGVPPERATVVLMRTVGGFDV